MHLQPLYAGAERFGGEVAADLFRRGICLPSSSSLTPRQQARVVAAVRSTSRAGKPRPPAPRPMEVLR
jgi:pyridoxal phosphate-dependent aminotransferase EpsN